MFKENQKHRQVILYGMVHQFPIGVMKRLDKSWAPAFRRLIFEKIDERRYAELYSTIESRPNFPVNIWVGLEILKGMFDYTDEELLDQFHFNLLTTRALGQDNLGDITLSERTLYYNRERLLEYEARTGRNLLEEEFQAITDEALTKLKINAKVQRMDSSMVGSCRKPNKDAGKNGWLNMLRMKRSILPINSSEQKSKSIYRLWAIYFSSFIRPMPGILRSVPVKATSM
jgi:hypothetical protein